MAESRLYRREAIVIKRQDFGEADKVITVYTPTDGKLRLLAKGVRKTTSRLGGNVELFVRANLLIARGRNLDIVTQAQTLDAFPALRDDPVRVPHAYYCAELLERLTEERQENYPAWELLVVTLGRLGSARSPELARLYFALHLLSHLGYRPQLRECLGCTEALQPVPNFISARAGGVLCPVCGRQDPGSRPLSVGALKVLRAMQRGEWERLDRLRLDDAVRREVEGVLDAFVHHLLERHLRSEVFLNAMRALDSVVGCATATGSADQPIGSSARYPRNVRAAADAEWPGLGG